MYHACALVGSIGACHGAVAYTAVGNATDPADNAAIQHSWSSDSAPAAPEGNAAHGPARRVGGTVREMGSRAADAAGGCSQPERGGGVVALPSPESLPTIFSPAPQRGQFPRCGREWSVGASICMRPRGFFEHRPESVRSRWHRFAGRIRTRIRCSCGRRWECRRTSPGHRWHYTSPPANRTTFRRRKTDVSRRRMADRRRRPRRRSTGPTTRGRRSSSRSARTESAFARSPRLPTP
jgi:hypothetical protein